MLHGFTQNSRCWGALAENLAADHRLQLVDAPGHGHSRHDDADLWAAASLIAESTQPGHVVGYSMGGRMALHLALTHPGHVSSLTLLGATPGIDDDDDRRARRSADATLAERLLDDGLDAFLDRWLSLDLFATLPPAAAHREARSTNRPEGLAASLVACGTGTQDPPLWDRLAEITVPTLLVTGADDAKFTAIAQRMAAALPSATHQIEGGGHAIAGERPAAVADRIRSFVASVS